MDAARTVKRLGATETLVVYRRDQPHMQASAFEAEEAVAEGVRIKWLRSIKAINGEDLTVEVMKLDENGRPQPTGQLETLHADAVVLAIGQDTDIGFLRKVPEIQYEPDGTVVVGPDMMTGRQGIFAGGDMVSSERTVTNAVGHGKKAARHIDAWLRGSVYEPPPKHKLVDFGMLNLPIFSDVPSTPQQELPIEDRSTGFEEVVAGLEERQALREARRCFSCGNCFECDNCLAACPEDAIVKLGFGKRYRVDLELCTGCATCVDQCPCHAMEIVEENA
jgi:NADPH-dependent glutamate synthase beta subunit-like oxidoreductase